jgi:hypothetical protein
VTQVAETYLEWSQYPAHKQASRVVLFTLLLCTAAFGADVTQTQWANRPRVIDRITEGQMVRDLSKYYGTVFQVVAAPQTNGDYTEMCELKDQLDDILQRANWVSVWGECNRQSTFSGSEYTIKFDNRSANAINALQGFLMRESWGGSIPATTNDGKPLAAVVGPSPTGRYIDVLIIIYDHAH